VIRPPISIVYAWRNVLARKASTLVTTLGIAVSVTVFIVIRATADGVSRVAVSSGSPRNVLVLAAGATSAELSYLDTSTLNRVRFVPGLERDANGDALASVELVLPLPMRRADAAKAAGRYATLRGVTPQSFAVHEGVRLETGRFPQSGSEVMIGSLLAQKLGVGLGDELAAGNQTYTISGTFDAAGQVFAGEVWAPLDALQSSSGRRVASVVVLRLPDVARAKSLLGTLENSPGINVSARGEQAYYREIQAVAAPFAALGNLTGSLLGLGAVLAGMNTLYAAMSRRTRELGTLRALGFSRYFVGGVLLLESLVVGVIGGLSGAGLALYFDGFALNLLGLSFVLSMPAATVLQGFSLALLIGVLGGVLPAYAALRIQIIQALRQA
jgi:ABC-type antimicrobial peptide transport system permease subunit